MTDPNVDAPDPRAAEETPAKSSERVALVGLAAGLATIVAFIGWTTVQAQASGFYPHTGTMTDGRLMLSVGAVAANLALLFLVVRAAIDCAFRATGNDKTKAGER